MYATNVQTIAPTTEYITTEYVQQQPIVQQVCFAV